MKQVASFYVAMSLTTLAARAAAAQSVAERDWFWHPGWGWGHMIFGSLMMIVFWGAIIVLVVLLVRWLIRGDASDQRGPASHPTALEVLQERFAKGEIDREEYEERRRILSE